MAGDDRLSTLSDDLLRRVLYFVPTKEAASTSVLSRRWGNLWRSCGAVNLVARVHDDSKPYRGGYRLPTNFQEREAAEEAFFSRRDAFFGYAEAALAHAKDAPVTKLTIHVETEQDEFVIDKFLHRDSDRDTTRDAVDALVSHRAARRVEELRVTATVVATAPWYWYAHGGGYKLASLPSSETLRLLDLTRCNGFTAAGAAFPLLATLRLRLCTVPAKDLQALLDAAPMLGTVNLESVSFSSGNTDIHGSQTAAEPPVVRLQFPVATALSLESCGAINLDAPKLGCFRYMGSKRAFSLTSQSPDLQRVDLHLHDDDRKDSDNIAQYRDKQCELFSQFVQNFTGAKTLKLKVKQLENIAVTSEKKQTELLCVFPNVEHLELEGVHAPTRQSAAVAIANLLRCCPVLAEIKLTLSTVSPDSIKDSRYGLSFLVQKKQLDYNKSIDRFTRRTSKRMIPLHDDSDDGNNCDGVSDIPGLSGHTFACLQGSLRRVGLQFRLDTPKCLGVRLVNFFAASAMVLQEMCLDCGNRRLNQHMNLDVERWVLANSTKASLKHKNLAENSCEFLKGPRVSLDSTTDLPRNSTTGFTVTPLRSRS